MSRMRAAIRQDVRLQARAKLYAIGIAVALLMGLAGRFFFASDQAAVVLPLFYLLGLGGTTFMFGASMLLLEKSDGTLAALRVSPLTAQEYLRSKAVTLTGFALFESAIVFAFVYREGAVQPTWLLAGLVALGLSYTYIGIGMACAYDSVTAFLFPSATLVSVVMQLPFLGPLGIGEPWAWRIVPTAGPLDLMRAGFGADVPLGYAVGMSLALVVGSMLYATMRFRRHIRLREV
ncbi:MAG: hypothetical protein AAGD14_03915 [Planctomycetota bacterium]